VLDESQPQGDEPDLILFDQAHGLDNVDQQNRSAGLHGKLVQRRHSGTTLESELRDRVKAVLLEAKTHAFAQRNVIEPVEDIAGSFTFATQQ
jgi:hypothetical protein